MGPTWTHMAASRCRGSHLSICSTEGEVVGSGTARPVGPGLSPCEGLGRMGRDPGT